jgi:hypothetical protein
MKISIVLTDDSGKHRKLTLSNHISLFSMDSTNGSIAQLPMIFGEGWQIIPVDLGALVKSIWGCNFRCLEQVT